MKHDSRIPAEWSLLLHAVFEDDLTSLQKDQLTSLLREQAAFRREYVLACQLTVQLGWQAAERSSSQQGPSPPIAGDSAIRAARRRRALAAAMTSAIVVLACWIGLRRLPSETLGNIVAVSGTVRLKRGGSQETISVGKSASSRIPLQNGDRIQTDRFSAFRIELADHSRLAIAAASDCTFQSDHGLRVTMPSGHLSAQVSPQRQGESLTIRTTQSQVRVLGTELEVLAGKDHSEVAVLEGRVTVTPTSGETVAEIAALQFARVAQDGTLELGTIPGAREDWGEDFEGESPGGWTGLHGDVEIHGRQAGVIGARSVSRSHGMLRAVSSPHQDSGLFIWHPDSVLHVSYRIQPPEWFHIEISARTHGASPKTLNYSYVNPDLWRATPGEWRTVDIPLAEFALISPVGDDIGLGRIPTEVSFSGNGPTGVEIDRVWVDRTRQP